jgi:hypothetical protein
MNELEGILILANTELDSCLAAGLYIENINYVGGVRYYHPGPENDDDEDDDGDEDDEDGDGYGSFYDPLIHPKAQVPPGSIIFGVDKNLDICFCDEEICFTNASKIIMDHALIVLIGYSEDTFNKIRKNLLTDEQEIIYLGNLYCTFLLAGIIDWKNRRDHSVNVRLAASVIWQSEFCQAVLEFPFAIGKKMRKQAEKLIDFYIDSWKIAYNIFKEDPEKLNVFFIELMNQDCNQIESQFIKQMMEMEPSLTEATYSATKEVKDQGQGIGLVNVGQKKVFKSDILLGMNYYCYKIIEYLNKESKPKTVSSDYLNNIYIKDGGFIKNDLIGKN